MSSPLRSNVEVVIGAQWGDEGKGKLVDLLSKNADAVCRCQGGSNAGHTVVMNGMSYFFHLLPTGITNPNALAVIGNGVVVNLPGLFQEIEEANSKGLKDISQRLRISDRSHIVFAIHQLVDQLEEEMRGKNSIGTTKRGIGPTYSSKINRNGLRFCDLMGDWDQFCMKYRNLVNYVKRRYPTLETNVEETLTELKEYRERLSGLVCDTVSLINALATKPGSHILIEGAQSCMLDIDFGTYPYVTSSNCSVGGVCTGLGIPPSRIGSVYGVMKAYTTRVGAGAFPTELLDGIGDHIQQVGKEWGVTTKRKRRVGWLDMVVIRYAHMINNFDAMALVKLDILDNLDEVKIGRSYMDPVTNQEVSVFPADPNLLDRVTVIYETLPGWKTSTFDCREYDALPAQARKYIETIENLLGVPIRWIGTGPSRESIILRNPT